MVSSVYCILAYLPFTFFSFVQAPPVWWLPWLARYQHWLFLPAILFLIWRGRTSGRGAKWFALAGTQLVLAAWVRYAPVLPTLEADVRSFGWALAFLAPVLIFLWPDPIPRVAPPPLGLALSAAGILAAISAFAAYVRLGWQMGLDVLTGSNLRLTLV